MDRRKELTRRLIADGFKDLMLRFPFDKISILMISNAAGIRRPSFYNHFQDKYDLLEWIVAEDVIAPSADSLRAGKSRDALLIMFSALMEEAAFYRKAYGVTGQNGFEDSFIHRLVALFLDCFPSEAIPWLPDSLTPEIYAHYNAVCIVSTARCWIESGRSLSPEALADAYLFLSDHSLWRMNVTAK